MELEGKRIHFIGIGGVSMSALAIMAQAKGAIVSGSDLCQSDVVHKLRERGICVYGKHASANVQGADIVVYTSAIDEHNVELVFALENNILVLKRAEFLGELAKSYKQVVAVAGCHGKTTVTAMVSQILIDAGLNPTVHLGGQFLYIGGNVRLGSNEILLTEACEFKNNFFYLKPTISVVLNVQPDHLDFFKNFKNVKLAFKKFLSNTDKFGFAIVNADDPAIFCPKRVRKISFSQNNVGCINAVNLKLHDDGTYSFDCLFDGSIRESIRLCVVGEHNVYNAMASIMVGLCLGVPFSSIAKSLSNFKGVDRRFQLVGKIKGANIIIDYAHHPTEIEAGIISAKVFTKNKVVAIFQPHTYSRTQAFMKEFVESLSGADKVAFYKIFPAREAPIEGIDHFALASLAQENGKSAVALSNYAELKKYIYDNAENGNTILLLGAGDFVSICHELEFD